MAAVLTGLDSGDRASHLADLVPEAGAALELALPVGPAFWADTRLGRQLPFWRGILDRPLGAVLAWQDPGQTRTGPPPAHTPDPAVALALWQESTGLASEGLAGLPVAVVRVPGGTEPRPDRELTGSLQLLLDHLGQPSRNIGETTPGGPAVEDIEPPPGLHAALVLPEHRRLADLLRERAGFHPAWDGAQAIPAPWSTAVLDAHRLAGRANAEAALARAQVERTFDSLWRALDTVQLAMDNAEAVRADADEAAGNPYPLDAHQDTNTYRWWLAERAALGLEPPVVPEGAHPAAVDPGAGPPLVTFVVFLDGSEAPPLLRRALVSVRAQTAPGWQLLLCGAPADTMSASIAAESAATDGRILQCPTPTGAVPAEAAGTWLAQLDPGDVLALHAVAEVAAAVVNAPEADVLYSDEDRIDGGGRRSLPSFKPDWSPDLLDATPYLGRLLLIRADLLRDLGPTTENVAGAEDYDLMLRATERAREVLHLPQVLYHRRGDPAVGPWERGGTDGAGPAPATQAQEAGARALRASLARRGTDGWVEDGPYESTYSVRRAVAGEPLVSIVIPFRDQPALLRTCVDTLARDPGYDRYEFLLVDNDSSDPETLALLERLAERPHHRIISSPGAFNWSVINNTAVEAAAGELLLFMNNDIEARRPGWMRALVEHAQRPEIGVVGSRLLYPNGLVQHVGVEIGLGGLAGHIMVGLPAEAPGYLGYARLTRNYEAVTAACLMTRREVFEEVGRFDESLAVAFNDVDFCLRVVDAGYRIVYTPLAELVHHESYTRGITGFYQDYTLFMDRWTDRLRRGDPFLNPNLSRLDSVCTVRPPDEDEKWDAILSRLTSSSNS